MHFCGFLHESLPTLYESQMIQASAQARQSGSVDQALRDTSTDASHPAWSETYARHTVAQQAHTLGPTVTEQMLASVQPGYVNDPSFDFGVHAKAIDLVAEVASQGEAQRQVLESTIATLMRNFGAHSRNMVRGILASTDTR